MTRLNLLESRTLVSSSNIEQIRDELLTCILLSEAQGHRANRAKKGDMHMLALARKAEFSNLLHNAELLEAIGNDYERREGIRAIMRRILHLKQNPDSAGRHLTFDSHSKKVYSARRKTKSK